MRTAFNNYLEESYAETLELFTTRLDSGTKAAEISSDFEDSNSTLTPIIPNQSHIGAWSTDGEKLDYLIISEINADTIKFEVGIIRIAVIWATAEIKNNEIKFGKDISLDYDGPPINGTLEFYNNSISVTISESEFLYIDAGTIYNFTVKDEK